MRLKRNSWLPASSEESEAVAPRANARSLLDEARKHEGLKLAQITFLTDLLGVLGHQRLVGLRIRGQIDFLRAARLIFA
ncbi:MAG: hypothetical protein MK180_10525 [Rhodobacteraceae bacterium]|nr:hypothetical protein [Paracoccaceae bacterium]